MICRRNGCVNPVWSWFYPPPWCSLDCRRLETADQRGRELARATYMPWAFDPATGELTQDRFAADLAAWKASERVVAAARSAPSATAVQLADSLPRPPSMRGWLHRWLRRVER